MAIEVEAPPIVIRNPVLTGFRPDPSILRVGSDYYVATSTFEWFPGVGLHHSRDLVHWRPLGGALTSEEALPLRGVRDSGGVWAPCLSYADGLFHLVYSNVGTYGGGFWDTPNFLVTAPDITGPWSEPVRLHSLGFDASMFHDDDGRSWMLSMAADYRPGRETFAGITLQEYDRTARRLVGEVSTIFTGTQAGLVEGPHLYRRDGWYYLVTAEGGTQWEHQVTVARSRTITGPYEVDPAGPTLTSWPDPALTLQKAGHGSLVATPDGEWYLAHLTGRPLTERGRCVLGRETALQRVEWSADGWPRVPGARPHDEVIAPRLEPHPWPEEPERDEFDAPALGTQWSTLRRPPSSEWLSLAERPGYLRLYGGESPVSLRDSSLVGRRVEHRSCAFEAQVAFAPTTFRQMAGVAAYYNTLNWAYARLSWHELHGPCVDVLVSDRGRLVNASAPVPVADPAAGVTFRAEIDGSSLRFGYALPGGELQWWPETHDASRLSDEYALEIFDATEKISGFTGAFFGLWAHDLTGGQLPADFAYATYEPR
ncbi:glycoside hydrolase family 43 protein [Cryptosporangium aurantiacum]|uniref:Xylan 1,4-beta-xylosidase n=1 Tax=Cryptosporangium aurantiacum TaxID=134849 RepID=A0A1M7HP01_9ACTN|nr:glycoside hydrolase family 43 protein [Cryptosporangium aurantiacum]SHM30236.1 xylan 1,4-beta-xylosidase [Cryptosporangium aurantiacum]